MKDKGTGEGNSLEIASFSASIITSPDHCLSNNDRIIISGCLGNIGSQVNDKVFKVISTTQNTFTVTPALTSASYFGGGQIKRIYNPFIQTKQFPVSWGMGRKTRIGVTQYLLTTTSSGQITILFFLSQNNQFPYNSDKIEPDPFANNPTLVYSSVLYTCPESTNLGLTAITKNLQMPDGFTQDQIWHRMNTSLIGDTVQLGFTLSDDQLDDPNQIYQFDEIELHAFILNVSPSQMLS